MIGINFYPTSERFLDHRAEAYPVARPDSGFHDLSAVRILNPPPFGLNALIRATWDRYATPIAITECHLGCTREEQLRWIQQSWDTCMAAERDGVDMRALTVWALFGSVDWDTLITVDSGRYEPGIFDIRGGSARPTALAHLVRNLATDTSLSIADPLASMARQPGWWQRKVRLEYPPFAWGAPRPIAAPSEDGRPIVITGASGTLGQAFAGACRLRNLTHVLTDRASLAIDDPASVAALLDRLKPWAVINAAGWVRVDDAENDEAGCFRANADGAAILAAACAARDIHCTLFSSDLVFDGTAGRAYVESDLPRPLNAYGRSKAAAERILDTAPDTLLIRTAAFFSPFDDNNFAVHVMRALRERRDVLASDAHVVSPTYVPDLVSACLDLIIDNTRGLWHLTNQEPITWFAFAKRLALHLDLETDSLVPANPEALGWLARRPLHAALGSERGALLPPLEDALARFAAEMTRRSGTRDRVAVLAERIPAPAA